MSAENYTEKRVDTRIDVLDYAMIEREEGSERLRSVVVDIALGGLQTRTREKLPVGSVCYLFIGSVAKDMIRIRGEVRHSKKLSSGLFASGIRFVPETHEERATIAAYLQLAFQRRAEFLL